jgi:hypothetical protein
MASGSPLIHGNSSHFFELAHRTRRHTDPVLTTKRLLTFDDSILPQMLDISPILMVMGESTITVG